MAKGKVPKPKTCKTCGKEYPPRSTTQTACSTPCAMAQAAEKKRLKLEAEQRKKWKERKADVKPIKHWEDLTQRVFNDYIRERDRDEPCISCGSYQAYEWHAGHYRTVAKASQLRFSEENTNKQCHSCNTHQSGNINPYRINLTLKIGEERVVAVENDNTIHRYTRVELDEIRAHYRAKLREMKKLQEAA
ncbi:recombination protein NinG [Serratia proteamaculans]|uniref:recombination protein NinG n=1 Tax=Serratia proteamaculans TaxID=28151 RepID=UPI00217A6F7F|nr:recombination protein NinG [Serratia proteamaculans]CAI1182408.1 Bacteriophage Lambda NinG protein [Serratia proteamaculans]